MTRDPARASPFYEQFNQRRHNDVNDEMAATTSSSLSSILEELDRAIVEPGLVASQVDIGTDESSILDLRSHLQQQLERHGDLDMNEIHLNWAGAPVPAWMPRTVTDTMGLTRSLSASEASSKAIVKPRARDISSFTRKSRQGCLNEVSERKIIQCFRICPAIWPRSCGTYR